MIAVFRVDASVQIGTGHVIRCLTLAKVLRERDAQCWFISRKHEGNLNDLIKSEGFHFKVLANSQATQSQSDQPLLAHAGWLGIDWHTDAQQTIEAIGSEKIDWLIIDHYALDRRWESNLRPYAKKIMVLDDLADREHDCDLLLDQNLVDDYQSRYNNLISANCTRLLGPQYALLQSKYSQLRARRPIKIGAVKRILVYFGGSDLHNMTGLAISAFLKLRRNNLNLDVVISQNNQHTGSIKNLARGHSSVTVYEALPSLAPLMVEADLAIGAAGATTWERCCLGLPAIVITVADNQIPSAKALHDRGLIQWVGHANSISLNHFAEALGSALDLEDLQDWSNNCGGLVDGEGAFRTGEIMLLNSNTLLRVRCAKADDENLLLRWANDPLVRKNAFDPALISPETHKAWFSSRLKMPDTCKLYVVETSQGYPIGQVRFEVASGHWEVHYALSAEARGKGLGRKFLKVALQEFARSGVTKMLFGRVLTENKASQKIFEKLGFSKKEVSDSILFSKLL